MGQRIRCCCSVSRRGPSDEHLQLPVQPRLLLPRGIALLVRRKCQVCLDVERCTFGGGVIDRVAQEFKRKVVEVSKMDCMLLKGVLFCFTASHVIVSVPFGSNVVVRFCLY